MRRPLAAMIVTVLGCAHGPVYESDVATGDAGLAGEMDEVDEVPVEAPADDAAPATEAPACIADSADREACRARGPGFSYGPIPYVYCSGVPPPPDHAKRHAESARNAPCVCSDVEAVRARIRACSQVPRRAPPPPGPPSPGP